MSTVIASEENAYEILSFMLSVWLICTIMKNSPLHVIHVSYIFKAVICNPKLLLENIIGSDSNFQLVKIVFNGSNKQTFRQKKHRIALKSLLLIRFLKRTKILCSVWIFFNQFLTIETMIFIKNFVYPIEVIDFVS